ncbi:MAG: hypothetical protein AB8E87_08685 [Prochlorococcus sp.]
MKIASHFTGDVRFNPDVQTLEVHPFEPDLLLVVLSGLWFFIR